MHKHGGDTYRLKNKVLDYSININPLGMPRRVSQAAKKGVDASIRYPDVTYEELTLAIAKEMNCPKEHIICGNGAADLIFQLVRSINPKRALILAPGFYEYEQALRSVSCSIDVFYVEEQNSFSLQEESVQEQFLIKITEDTDIVFLCNPNNPTGMLTDRELIHKILVRCKEMDAVLVVDECFMDFVEERKNQSVIKDTKNYDNLMVLKAFTKLYAMPGLRLGFLITSKEAILAKMQEASQPWAVSIPAERAGIASLKEMRYRKKTSQVIKKEKSYLLEQLHRLPLTVYHGESNFILFFSERKDLQGECLKHNIWIRDCSNFQGLSEGYYRICVRKRRENKKLIRTLREVL